MSTFSADAQAFAKVVSALESYLADVVFVGGWAHHLYTLHPTATVVPFEPLRTLDADIAAPLGLGARGATIAARLKEAGFVQEFKGDDTPPISEYRLGEEAGGFYVEFLAPLVGGDRDRWGHRNATTVVGGVTAQTLRYLDVLLIDPWGLVIGESNGFPLGPEGMGIRIANPVSFFVQKILVFKNRPPLKQGKDLLYIHDTLYMFADAIPRLKDSWSGVRKNMVPAHVTRFRETAIRLFTDVSDAARTASRIAADAGRAPVPTPEDITATCRAGFRTIFGD